VFRLEYRNTVSKEKNDGIKFIIDFLNIAYFTKEDGKAKIENVLLVEEALHTHYPKATIVMIADASARHHVNKPAMFEAMTSSGKIITTPAKEQADYYILRYAEAGDKRFIITNDQYNDHSISDDIRSKIISFAIIDGEVIFNQKVDECIEYPELKVLPKRRALKNYKKNVKRL